MNNSTPGFTSHATLLSVFLVGRAASNRSDQFGTRRCLDTFDLVCVLVSVSVSLLEIEGFVGDTVILPCLSSGKELPNKVTVFWRFRDSGAVYNIVDSRASLDEQDAPFRGRVDSFPDEWTKGNFSIKLSGVKKTDGGMYTCFIHEVNIQTTIYLIVNGTSEHLTRH
uniref:Ig-like domain-containing protein n=1 Tax=Pygocentrus nattereri TaxID=42514 RepID=A0A3B4EM75_PYGNA